MFSSFIFTIFEILTKNQIMKTIPNTIYFDGESSNFRTISIRMESTQLVLLDENFTPILAVKPTEINLNNSSFTKKEVKLFFSSNPEKMLWFRNSEDSKLIIKWLNSHDLKTKIYGSYFTPTIFGIFGSLIFLSILFYLSIPFLSGIIANHIPIETEKKLGETFLQQMLNKDGTEIKSSLLDSANMIFTQYIDSKEIPITIYIVDSKIVNAFSLPGGNLVVYTGMIEKLNSAESYYALLGHEIGHTANRHVLKGIIQNSVVLIGFSLLFGDASNVLAGFGSQLTTLSYNRDAEREADLYAIEQLRENHFTAKGLVELFEALKKQGDLPESLEFMSTHPVTEERLGEAKKIVSEQSDLKEMPEELKIAWNKIKNETEGKKVIPHSN